MKKYFTIFKTGWADAFTYRTEFFISLLSWTIRLAIFVFIFQAVFSVRQQISGYTLKDTINYLIIMQILMTLVFTRMGFQISTDIQNGDFSNFLLKPVSYLWYQIITEFSQNLLRSLFGGIIFGIILAFFSPEFLTHMSTMNILIGMVAIIISYLLNAFLIMSIAMLAFWITSSGRLIFIFFGILTIFSGMSIPLDFFPDPLRGMLFYTPFPYLFYFPSQILMGRLTEPAFIILFKGQLFFTLIAFVLAKIILYFGIKKYEAVGR